MLSRYFKYKESYVKYRIKHAKLIASLRDKKMFDGKRKEVLKRDNYTCQSCGMVNQEHQEIWECSITVDHIDGKGSSSKIKNNNLDNLITLCLRCHGKKDIKRRRPWRQIPVESRAIMIANLNV